ncbi:MAG: hypothetical protein K0R57_6380 [Paenibacillaceae bacterium]|nr:hypothetical protein [Paenibacillaceae bacterium]
MAGLFVFDLGGLSASQMPDGLVVIQNGLHLIGQFRVNLWKPFR